MKHRKPKPLTKEEREHQQALGMLVTKFAREFVELAAKEMGALAHGGSRLPWRYTKQFNEALDRAEDTLRERHPEHWSLIVDQVAIRNSTPEDFQ
jgi:hypothetical protein